MNGGSPLAGGPPSKTRSHRSSRAGAHAALSEPVVDFRSRLVELLDRWTPIERFYYLDADTVVMVCPVCDGPLGVYFAGTAACADLVCRRGCVEAEVIAAITGRAAG